MKGVRITKIYSEPLFSPHRIAMIGEVICAIVSLIVGIVRNDLIIGIGLTLLMLFTFALTYCVYKADKSLREQKECFVQIGKTAEYEDIKEFHERYKVIEKLSDGRYIAVRTSHKRHKRQKKDNKLKSQKER